jgi:hypothetical protein
MRTDMYIRIVPIDELSIHPDLLGFLERHIRAPLFLHENVSV